MCPTDYENDELVFVDEDDDPVQVEEEPIVGEWHVLIVDDDEEIHSVTRLALSDLVLNGKKLSFHHAYSGSEALAYLRKQGDQIAIILLDVVMESDDAGLQVARTMREELNWKNRALFFELASLVMRRKKMSLKNMTLTITKPKLS